MPTPIPSLLEIFETLKRTNLPTVITEGKDDYTFYRMIEEELSDLSVSLIPVGGRPNLLEIFNRRKELGRNNIVFLADQDLWVYGDIPLEYHHRKMFFTDGYSIENDLFRDGEICNFLRGSEHVKFFEELRIIVAWYSYCIRKLLSNENATISEHPNHVISESGQLNGEYMAEIGFCEKDQELFDRIMSDYAKLLRGKTLIELITRQLSARNRETKFGKKQIMEIGASRRGPHMKKIVHQISGIIPSL